MFAFSNWKCQLFWSLWKILSDQTSLDLYVVITSESNGTRALNRLVRKRTLNHLAKLARWLSWVVTSCLQTKWLTNYVYELCLQTKWLWVRIPLLLLKLQIRRLLRARSSLVLRQTTVSSFTLKFVRDMIITYSLLLISFLFSLRCNYFIWSKLMSLIFFDSLPTTKFIFYKESVCQWGWHFLAI